VHLYDRKHANQRRQRSRSILSALSAIAVLPLCRTRCFNLSTAIGPVLNANCLSGNYFTFF